MMAVVNFVAGLMCVGLAVNFFMMAYTPKVSKSLPLYTNQLTTPMPDDLVAILKNFHDDMVK